MEAVRLRGSVASRLARCRMVTCFPSLMASGIPVAQDRVPVLQAAPCSGTTRANRLHFTTGEADFFS